MKSTKYPEIHLSLFRNYKCNVVKPTVNIV